MHIARGLPGPRVTIRPAASARIIAAAAAILMAVTFDVPSRAGPAAADDETARQEVAAAYQKLEAMSYRMRMTAPGQTVVVEHVPPNSRRTITQITGEVGEVETVAVDNDIRSRVTGPGVPGTWECSAAGPQRPIVLTMKDFGMALDVSRRPDILIAGSPAHTYELVYSLQGGKPAGATILYIDAQTGLPRRSVTPYPLGAGEVIVDYYDYGAPISITLPACGEKR